MCQPISLSAWNAELEGVFPFLSKPQVKVLAQYSMGIVLAERCGLSCVATALAAWLSQTFDAVRERLRDWYCGATDKSGHKRRELDVESCFAPLLNWVLQDWQSNDLAIALDATSLGQRFVVLAISVVYRSCAIPVAWVVLPATAKGAWKPHWLRLLVNFKQIVPSPKRVIVLADRGLYAKWLFEAIVDLGWHPLLRINPGNASFKAEHASRYVPIASRLPRPGCSYSKRGVMFRTRKTALACTLVAHWSAGHEQGWFMLTDLAPDQADWAWYSMRCWIECGFKYTKRGGWNWQNTRMDDPARTNRQWLAMAVANVMVMRQAAIPQSSAPSDKSASAPTQPPAASTANPKSSKKKKPAKKKTPPTTFRKDAPSQSPHPRRILSAFRVGLLFLQAALLANRWTNPHVLIPEPWPQSTQNSPEATDKPP